MTLGLNTTLSPFLTPLTQNIWDQQPLEAEWFPQLWLGYQGQPPSVHGKRACAAQLPLGRRGDREEPYHSETWNFHEYYKASARF